VCVIDPASDSLAKLDGTGVGLDEYKIQSFREAPSMKTVFTSGVQRCTAIAGYDPEIRVGFIAHFRPSYKEKEQALMRIDREIRERHKSQGIKDMNLFVVGGIKDDPESVANLIDVYEIIVNKFGITQDDISKFHSGISRNIAIHNGKIKVF